MWSPLASVSLPRTDQLFFLWTELVSHLLHLCLAPVVRDFPYIFFYMFYSSINITFRFMIYFELIFFEA